MKKEDALFLGFVTLAVIAVVLVTQVEAIPRLLEATTDEDKHKYFGLFLFILAIAGISIHGKLYGTDANNLN